MLYIIRHGKTDLNAKMLMQGRSDHPLNDAGLAQAEEAAGRFRGMGVRIDKVYSSPLIRAVQTAEAIAPDADLVIDERLIEMDYGPYEGMDLNDPAPEVLDFFMDFVNVPAPEGMEPLPAIVEERLQREAERKNQEIKRQSTSLAGISETGTAGFGMSISTS